MDHTPNCGSITNFDGQAAQWPWTKPINYNYYTRSAT